MNDTRFAPPTLVLSNANHPAYLSVDIRELDRYEGWSLVLVVQESAPPYQHQQWDPSKNANVTTLYPQVQHRAILMRDLDNATTKLQKALEAATADAAEGKRLVDRALKQETEAAERMKRVEADLIALSARLNEEKQKAAELHGMAHKLERGMNEERKKLDKLKAVLGSERFEQILNEKPTSPG